MKEQHAGDVTFQEQKWEPITVLPFVDVCLKSRESSGSVPHVCSVGGNSQSFTDTLSVSSSTCEERKGVDVAVEFLKELGPLRESSSEIDVTNISCLAFFQCCKN